MVSRRTFLQSSSAAALGAIAGCSALPFVGDGASAPALVPSSNVHRRGGFGQTVAIDRDTLVVGAKHALNQAGEFGGTAFVYEYSGGEWVKEARLQPPGDDLAGPMAEEARLSFGSYVAAVNGTVVVGTADAPAAYLYERSGEGWRLTESLYPDTDAGERRHGTALSFDGDTLAMATMSRREDDGPAIETVHVFERRDYDWQEVASFQRDDAPEWDLFGYSVGVDDGTLVVGGTRGGEDEPAARQSIVWVYERDGAEWSEEATIRPESGYTFGGVRADRAIEVSGDTFVVGDLMDFEGSKPGRTFVFARSNDGWDRQAVLRPDALAQSTNFGAPLALDGDTLVAAAHRANVDTDVEGSAFRYERSGGDWTVTRRFSDSDAVRPGTIGFDVALSQDWIAVGGRVRREDVANQEGVYVFPR